MSLLTRLLRALGLQRSEDPRSFEVGADLLPIIRAYADAEGRSLDDALNDLVTFAGRERQRAQTAAAGWSRLTPREQEVVALACLGYSNPNIADALAISRHTARSHLRNAYERLDIHSKKELREYFAGWDFEDWVAMD